MKKRKGERMKNIGIAVGVVVLILIGMNQYESYKLNKTVNDGVEAIQKNVKMALSAEKLKDTTCLEMNMLRTKFDMFKLDNGSYPTTREGIEALIMNPGIDKYPNYPEKPYLKDLPKDSWGNPFSYTNIGGTVELISLGADGVKGGSGTDKDIYFSECI